MVCALRPGQRTWRGSRDSEGHRSYWIKFRVWSDAADGPANVLQTPGLPLPGAWWLVDNDVDLWAWVRPDTNINPVPPEPETLAQGPSGGAGMEWDVEVLCSTKPPERNSGHAQRCQDVTIQDPLLEPPKISGTFVKYSQERAYDMNGKRICNSAFELLRGPQVEFDSNRQTVKIDQNILDINIPLLQSMVNTLNVAPLWGCPARTVKLEPPTWERRFYGACYKYFNRVLEFTVSADFDRDNLDEGTKCVRGYWAKNIQPPTPAVRATVTVDGSGGVNGFTIFDGPASGLPKSSVLGFLVDGGGHNAIVQVMTDPAGAVQIPGIFGIYLKGTGYTAGVYTFLPSKADQWAVTLDDPDVTASIPDLNSTSNYQQFVDRNGNATKCTLDGLGYPAYCYDSTLTRGPGKIHVAAYPASDFTLLGIPLSL